MPPGSYSGIVTAIATVITALGGLILAFAVIIPILRNVKQVHTIVNQQQTDLKNYQAALIRALHDAGIKVPLDQSATAGVDSSHDDDTG